MRRRPFARTALLSALSLEQVYGAIAFYLAHGQEVDANIREGEEEIEHSIPPLGESRPELYARLERARREISTQELANTHAVTVAGRGWTFHWMTMVEYPSSISSPNMVLSLNGVPFVAVCSGDSNSFSCSRHRYSLAFTALTSMFRIPATSDKLSPLNSNR